MAQHYKRNPYVIGWQVDNEINGPSCFCNSCKEEWHDWLRTCYGTIKKLNHAWGTHFWGQFYKEWAEIQMPPHAHHNPSLMLDWHRFNSWLNVRFQNEQISIIKEVCPHHFVTHNFMGFGTNAVNPYDLAKELDFVSWDNYPIWSKPDIKYNAACMADLTRGLKQKNFWIMEQTAGPGGWDTIGRNPRPGEITNIAFQQVAHGADAIIWFRWRTCSAGHEQYWHGILGYNGIPGRRYKECKKTATTLHKISSEIKDTTVRSEVAIIYDQESRWAFESQNAYENNTIPDAIHRYYDSFFRKGINVDIINTDMQISKYKILIAPQLLILSPEIARKLNSFVRYGGILLGDIRMGVKTKTNLCHEKFFPAFLTNTFGIKIEEYEGLLGGDNGFTYKIVGRTPFEGIFTSSRFVDWVIPEKAKVLAQYTDWHMSTYAALTKNKYGKGYAYYLGTIVREIEFYDMLISEILRKANIHPLVHLPAGVELSIREGKNKKIMFLINHTEEEKSVPIPDGKLELLSNKHTDKTILLDKYGIAVIKIR